MSKPKRGVKDKRKHASSIIICICPNMAAKFVEVGQHLLESKTKI